MGTVCIHVYGFRQRSEVLSVVIVKPQEYSNYFQGRLRLKCSHAALLLTDFSTSEFVLIRKSVSP